MFFIAQFIDSRSFDCISMDNEGDLLISHVAHRVLYHEPFVDFGRFSLQRDNLHGVPRDLHGQATLERFSEP